MLQDRLTSLAVLHVHRDIDIDIDIVMRKYLNKNRNTLLHAPFDSQSLHIAILSTCFKCYCVYFGVIPTLWYFV
jgi:hypothetical protein